jgi:single-strand DNA-binding protein
MAVAFNKVILAGNLTRDPQTKFITDERAVCNFGLAINKRFKDKAGEMKEDVTFVDIEAWGRTAELVGQYLTKGKSCIVDGSLKLDTWEKDGQKHQKLKVVAESVQFLGGKDDGEKRDENKAVTVKPTRADPVAPAIGGGSSDQDPPFQCLDSRIY